RGADLLAVARLAGDVDGRFVGPVAAQRADPWILAAGRPRCGDFFDVRRELSVAAGDPQRTRARVRAQRALKHGAALEPHREFLVRRDPGDLALLDRELARVVGFHRDRAVGDLHDFSDDPSATLG